MRTATKFMATAAVVAGAMLASAPANALVITKPFTAPPGPYNLANPNGTIAALRVFKANTYNFTFTTTGKFDVLVQMQASAFKPSVPQLLAFSLFKGVPGSGVFVTNSGAPITGPAIDTILQAGQYYVQIDSSTLINKGDEFVTGGLTLSAVPEPATWAMMITGFGLLGLAARRRRELATA
jgi:hypothetical protein